MEINETDLKKYAGKLLKVLDSEGIKTTRDLEACVKVGKSLEIDGERIEFSLRPSNFETRTYTMDYIIPNKGIIIQLKINPSMKYLTVITKNRTEIKGYTPFAIDGFGNPIQFRNYESTDMNVFLKELENLSGKLNKTF